jgi:uncharacterized membrane protein
MKTATSLSLALASLSACVLFLASPVSAQSGEYIDSFDSAITVNQDGTIDVVETIEYYFPSPKHGIYRDIPVKYENDEGERYEIPVTVKSVGNGSGGSWRYSLERGEAGLRVKIGDPNATITGLQTYVISYTLSGALRYFDDHDELYWNATGTEWQVPVRGATAEVSLPGAIPSESIEVKCYTGPKGSTASDCSAVAGTRAATFSAEDFLTVVVGWAPGLVAKLEPEYEKPVSAFGLLWPFTLTAALGIFLFRRWWHKGRDPKGRGTLVVQYDPPENALPAEVGVLIDQRADTRDLTATIIDLAVRGFIKIREIEIQGLILKGKDHELERLKDPEDPQSGLKAYEKKIMSTLFALGTRVTIGRLKSTYAFSAYMKKITGAMYDEAVLRGWYDRSPEAVRNAYIGIGTTIMVLTWFLGSFAALMGPMAPFAIGACGALLVIFGFVMARRTEAGVLAYEHAVGFKEYLSRAEQYRLQWQEEENIFERFLPYAMVFGVVDKWCKAFEGLTINQPNWYEGSAFHAGVFNAAVFSSAFNSLGSAINSAVTSHPSQSSSGSGFGGGSSGGGGGGGGGGSW